MNRKKRSAPIAEELEEQDGEELKETFQDLYSDEDLRLDHIPDVSECRRLIKKFTQDGFSPNVWHVNDHGNADLLRISYNGAKIVISFV